MVIVRQGSIRQCLADAALGQVPLGLVSGIAWKKQGFDLGPNWAMTQEQGWRDATARVRGAARALGATAVVNLRHRLCGDGEALGFTVCGDAIREAHTEPAYTMPCVPFGQQALRIMRRHGMRPTGFAVGAFASDDFILGYDPVLAGWGSGELDAFNDWKFRAREAAIARLLADPDCAGWSGALAHREYISLDVIRRESVVWSVRLRVAVSRLGFQRHPGIAAPLGQIFCGLESALSTDSLDRPVFYGIDNETTLGDATETERPEAETPEFGGPEFGGAAFGMADFGGSTPEIAPDMTNDFGFGDNSGSFDGASGGSDSSWS